MSTTMVQEVASYTISPSSKSLGSINDPFELGPMDHLLHFSIPIQVVAVYRAPSDVSFLDSTLFRQALRLLLEYYPHLTGRLRFEAKSGRPYISALGTGVGWRDAICQLSIKDIISLSTCGRLLLQNLPGAGNELLAPFDSSLKGVSRDPILMFQHTRFACGGVALGIRLHHIVGDAQGLFTLIGHLTEIYQQLRVERPQKLKHPPHIISIFREPLSVEERRSIEGFQPANYRLVQASQSEMGNVEPETTIPAVTSPNKVEGRVLRFTTPLLAEMKMQISNQLTDTWVSTYEIVTAYLYLNIYRARQRLSKHRKTDEINTGFLVSIDTRPPHLLNLTKHYFPNAIYCALASTLLLSKEASTVADVARAVHKLIRHVTPQEVGSTIKWIAAQPDKRSIELRMRFGDGSFLTSQWSKMGMYKNLCFEFDAHNRPIYPDFVSTPFSKISTLDGLVYILATEEECQDTANPSLDVNIALSLAVWDSLDQDKVFHHLYAR